MRLPGIGEVFQGKYETVAVLGQGGYALVYHARVVGVERDVALKILEPGRDGKYLPEVESRFQREIKIVSKLRDPHTVTLYDFGRSEEGLFFMVFEYIPGEDLESLIARVGAFPEERVIHIVRQVLECLREAHGLGLLHRDIKPDNIRVHAFQGDPNAVKVLDFGIAKWTDLEKSQITEAGQWIGTPQFMSPEQIYGAPLTAASDLYSLGLVAFQMLTGRPFVAGELVGDLFRQHASKKPRRLPADTAVSDGFRDIVERMILHDAGARYQSAQEVLDALDAVQGRSSGPPPGSGMVRPGDSPATMVENSPFRRTADEKEPTVRQRAAPTAAPQRPPAPAKKVGTAGDAGDLSWLGVVMAGLLAGAGVVVIILMLSSGQDEPEAPIPPPPPPAPAYAEGTGEPETLPDRALPPDPPARVSPWKRARALVREAHVTALGTDTRPASGCGAASVITGLRPGRQEFWGRSHKWWVYVPESYDSDERYPVVMMFHAYRALEASTFLRETRFDELADEHGFIVIVPQSANLYPERPWSDIDIEARVAVEILAATQEEFCVDPERTYVLGHGNGARMGYRLRCEAPIAALAVTSYRLARGEKVCKPQTPVPTLFFTGEKDGFYPIYGSRDHMGGTPRIALAQHEEIFRLQNECTRKTEERSTKDYTCNEWTKCLAPFVSCVHHYGHDWEGAEYSAFDGLFAERGGPPMTFPVGEEVWRFFAERGQSPLPLGDPAERGE